MSSRVPGGPVPMGLMTVGAHCALALRRFVVVRNLVLVAAAAGRSAVVAQPKTTAPASQELLVYLNSFLVA